MSRTPHRRGSLKEVNARKLSGRRCTFIVIPDSPKARPRRCTNNTGKNYFFCKQHLSLVDDYGMETL